MRAKLPTQSHVRVSVKISPSRRLPSAFLVTVSESWKQVFFLRSFASCGAQILCVTVQRDTPQNFCHGPQHSISRGSITTEFSIRITPMKNLMLLNNSHFFASYFPISISAVSGSVRNGFLVASELRLHLNSCIASLKVQNFLLTCFHDRIFNVE
jgi:hypothetical protein